MKNMLLDILKNQMGDVKNMAYQGDVRGIENLMSGLQTVSCTFCPRSGLSDITWCIRHIRMTRSHSVLLRHLR